MNAMTVVGPSKSLLGESDLAAERLRGMLGIFAQADSTLCGKRIKTTLAYGGPAPGWSDSDTITFNSSMIGDVNTVDDVVALTGLNYHEIGHVLYTPGKQTPFIQRIVKADLFGYMNVLEDQRIETLLAAQYPSTRPYFSTIFMKWVIANTPDQPVGYAFAYGRRFLPSTVRLALRKAFIDQTVLPEIEHLIDSYRRVAFPENDDVAFDLVKRFADLMKAINAQLPKQPPNGHGNDTGTDWHDSGNTPKPGEQKEARDKAKQDDDDGTSESKDEPKDEADGKGKSDDTDTDDTDAQDGDGADGDSDDDADSDGADGGSDGDSDTDGDDADDDADSDGEGDGSGSGGDADFDDDDDDFDDDGEGGDDGEGEGDAGSDGDGGHGAGGGASTPVDITDVLQDAIDQVAQDKRMQQEVADVQRKVQHGDPDSNGADADIAKRSRNWPHSQVDVNAVGASRRLAKQFERLATEIDPGWDMEKPTGRLNIQRAMQGGELDRLFDQWNEGNSMALDIECVILLDASSSMNNLIGTASQTLWTIKRAMETIGASVTVLLFTSNAEYLYTPGEKSAPTKFKRAIAGGNTDPTEALLNAKKVFHYSKRHVKYLITISDGAWFNAHRSEQIVQELNAAGIVTAAVFLTDPILPVLAPPTRENHGHGCQVFRHVSDLPDLTLLVKELVTFTARNRKVR